MEHVSTGTIVNTKYELEKMIGRGQFGEVYSGKNINTGKHIVIKLEIYDKNNITLKNEATILKYLYDNRCVDVPLVHWYGKYKHYIGLVIPRYDCSLYDYAMNNKLDSLLIDSIMLNAISIIEKIHNLFVVHRDIKPQHFMLKGNQLVLIDFGISTFYIDDEKNHKPDKMSESIIGTSNYASYNLYNGHAYSRRDDLISIGYMYLFLHTLELPWQQLNRYDYTDNCSELSLLHTKNIECKKMKELLPILSITSKINNHFGIYMNNCYSLAFAEDPQYVVYISLFYS
jgi:serine/threonine protein kinase|uniref:Protein kinase domain-containing protein n=1 Tax=viral metagenome TaxID=1070528 RepID=A0A6C0IPC4_9ZZZZ